MGTCVERLRSPMVWLTVLFAGLVLYRLDNSYLWQDEAETAVLAYNTYQHGLPVVDDGLNILLEGGHEYNADGIWTWQPWMQYYVGAAGYVLLPKGTLAARLPFALIGIACIPLAALLARRLFPGRLAVARLGTFFLVTSVPFILFARQCRNYTLATFFTLLLLWAYVGFLSGRRRARSWMTAALVLLYYSHILMFLGIGFGIVLHYLIARRARPEALLRIAPPFAVAFVLTVPWFFYSGGFERHGQFDVDFFIPNVLRFFLWINNYLFPAVLLIVPALALAGRLRRGTAGGPEGRRRRQAVEPPTPRPTNGVGGGRSGAVHPYGILVGIPLAATLPWLLLTHYFFRYFVIFIPLTSLLLALCVLWLWDRRNKAVRTVAVAGVLLLSTSNILHAIPLQILPAKRAYAFLHNLEVQAERKVRAKLSDLEKRAEDKSQAARDHLEVAQGRSLALLHEYRGVSVVYNRRQQFELPFLYGGRVSMQTAYMAELLSEYDGPIGAIVKHLKEHAKPGDKAWIVYGDLPLIFYNEVYYQDLQVVSWYQAALEVDSYVGARWIIPRHGNVYRYRRAGDRRVHAHIKGKSYPGGAAMLTPTFYQTLRDAYALIRLTVPDPRWENRPDPDLHYFVTPLDGSYTISREEAQYLYPEEPGDEKTVTLPISVEIYQRKGDGTP